MNTLSHLLNLIERLDQDIEDLVAREEIRKDLLSARNSIISFNNALERCQIMGFLKSQRKFSSDLKRQSDELKETVSKVVSRYSQQEDDWIILRRQNLSSYERDYLRSHFLKMTGKIRSSVDVKESDYTRYESIVASLAELKLVEVGRFSGYYQVVLLDAGRDILIGKYGAFLRIVQRMLSGVYSKTTLFISGIAMGICTNSATSYLSTFLSNFSG